MVLNCKNIEILTDNDIIPQRRCHRHFGKFLRGTGKDLVEPVVRLQQFTLFCGMQLGKLLELSRSDDVWLLTLLVLLNTGIEENLVNIRKKDICNKIAKYLTGKKVTVVR